VSFEGEDMRALGGGREEMQERVERRISARHKKEPNRTNIGFDVTGLTV
jgi:hypothetical protein